MNDGIGCFAGPKTVNRAAKDSGLSETIEAAILGGQSLTTGGTRLAYSRKL